MIDTINTIDIIDDVHFQNSATTPLLTYIESTPVNQWIQDSVEDTNAFKTKLSEVATPYTLVEEMLNSIPPSVFPNQWNQWKRWKILDAGCGTGNLSLVLYHHLFMKYGANDTYRYHLLNNVLHMIDINSVRIQEIQRKFPCKNIYNHDFTQPMPSSINKKYDFIISNPPFIITTEQKKKETIWPLFFQRCMHVLRPHGHLLIIIPSIWMKPEHYMYDVITEYRICHIKCFNNNEANDLFRGDARTPICYMLVENAQNPQKNASTMELYDNMCKRYISIHIYPSLPIPMYFPQIMKKIYPYIKKYGSLQPHIVKTNCPSPKIHFQEERDILHVYPNIKTCRMKNKSPEMVVTYSDIEGPYSKKRKVILSNKMYGIPYYDANGTYGISTRDNYLFVHTSEEACKCMANYLSRRIMYIIYETTRYRMGYLEKYAFEWVPNIFKLPLDNKSTLTDDELEELFQLTTEERQWIRHYAASKRVTMDYFCASRKSE